MTLDILTEDFQCNQHTLTVKAAPGLQGWQVRVFHEKTPVTAIVYTVSYEVEIDNKVTDTMTDVVQHLMDVARSDVLDGRVHVHLDA